MEQPEVLPVDPAQVVVALADDPTQEAVIRLVGEHDMSSVEELAQAVSRVLDGGWSDLVVDLSRVEFMDSVVVNQLLIASKRLGMAGRTVRVRDPSPAARHVLELCGLTHLVEP